MIARIFAGLALSLVLLASPSRAEDPRDPNRDWKGFGPQAGDWEFTLSGSGTSDNDIDRGGASGDASLGFYVAEVLELGVRQNITYNNFRAEEDSEWGFATRAFVDFVFDLKAVRPFVGASIGYVYGDNVKETWAGGIEAGVKFYVKPQTFLFGSVEYLWFFDNGSEADDTFDDGRFAYTVGVGFNF